TNETTDLVRALDEGRPFGVSAGSVGRIDTTAAHVFLVDDRAYKMKRPVRFSFLDFGSRAARRAAFENELRLNRRTAPDLYLGLVKLVDDGGLLCLAPADDARPAVEWLLEMVRFPAEAQLDRIAAAGPLSGDLADALGRAVVDLHRDAEPRPDKGGAEAMAEVVAGNRADLAGLRPGLLAAADVARVDRAARRALDRLAPLLDERRAQGFVRHCHGDLHLRNVVALDGRVVPFDCIEFNDDFACIDVAYDLAFLLMDLVHRGDGAAAHRVLQIWLDETDDVAALHLLPFFMAVRATVRAKVEALAPEGEADAGRIEAARAYLALALALEPPPPPRLIAVGGLSGSGKSTLARVLAPALRPLPGAIVVRSDVVRKGLWGVPPSEKLPATAYGSAVTERVFETLRTRAAAILDAGFSVIVDAVHRRPDERAAVQAVAERAGVPFDGLWLDAPADVLVARVRERVHDASDADEAVVRAQLDLDAGPIEWLKLPAEQPVEVLAARVVGQLERDPGTCEG
ncbi:MAG: AAA family ATPase, partial [Pseudomonadota bacterium]